MMGMEMTVPAVTSGRPEESYMVLVSRLPTTSGDNPTMRNALTPFPHPARGFITGYHYFRKKREI